MRNCRAYGFFLKKEGDFISIIIVSLIFNATDFLTGFLIAWKNNEIKSSKLRDGFFKKIGFILCYILGLLLGYLEKIYDFGFNVNILPFICGYVILTEIISIIENIGKINPDILPDKLMKIIGIKKEGET